MALTEEELKKLNTTSLVNTTTVAPSTTLKSRLDSFSPTIDTSSVKGVSTDLTASKDAVLAAGRGVTKQDYLNLDIRPENKYEKTLDSSISKLDDYSNGNSKVDRTIANAALDRFDASQAAATISQAQRIASNPHLSDGAKNVANAELARMAGSQRATLTGELAQQSQERAFSATQKLADIAIDAVNYEEDKFQSDMKLIGDNLTRELTAKIAAGELTQAEASLELSKQQSILRASIDEKQMDLEKLRGLDSFALDSAQMDLSKKQIEQKQIELDNAEISMWGVSAANAITEWKMSNLDKSVSDMMNDPNGTIAVQMATNYYKSLVKDDSATPTDSWLEAFFGSVKTKAQSEMEFTEDTVRALRTQYVDSELMTDDEFNEVIDEMKLYSDFEGTVQRNKKGQLYFANLDGSVRKDNNKTPMIISDDKITDANGDEIVTKPDGTIFSEESKVYKMVDGVQEDFVLDTDDIWGDDANEIIAMGPTEGKPFYSKILKVRKDEIASDPWSDETNSIYEDPTNPLYQKVFDERVNSILESDNGTIDVGKLSKLSADDPVYKKVAASSEITYFDGASTIGDKNDYHFNVSVQLGDVIKQPDGRLYKVTTGPTYKKASFNSKDDEYIVVQDILTGVPQTLTTRSIVESEIAQAAKDDAKMERKETGGAIANAALAGLANPAYAIKDLATGNPKKALASVLSLGLSRLWRKGR